MLTRRNLFRGASGCTGYYSHRNYWDEPKRVNYHDLGRHREEIFDNGRYLTERIAEEAAGFLTAEDPGETRNVRHQHPELVDELAGLAHQWRQSVETN